MCVIASVVVGGWWRGVTLRAMFFVNTSRIPVQASGCPCHVGLGRVAGL